MKFMAFINSIHRALRAMLLKELLKWLWVNTLNKQTNKLKTSLLLCMDLDKKWQMTIGEKNAEMSLW